MVVTVQVAAVQVAAVLEAVEAEEPVNNFFVVR
jgi:hypothetical protein